MSSQDVYGRRYWSVTIYQARLLFFLPPDYETLRDVKTRAEAAGEMSLKKVNWEKLHVLGLLDVDRKRRDWVYVRRGPLWQQFWDEIGVDPETDDGDVGAKVTAIDAVFGNGDQKPVPFPPAPRL